MSDDGRDRWLKARTLSELGELTALWLEGRIAQTPGYLGQPDPETVGLVPALAAVNRAGYVTEFSQPGEPPDARSKGWQQRAAVSGFCDNGMKNRIKGRLLRTDLVLIAIPPGGRSRLPHGWESLIPGQPPEIVYGAVALCVSTGDEQGSTCIGGWVEDAFIDHCYGGGVHPDGLRALHEAWQVAIVDPVWGRNDLLWPRLVEALKR
jgi:hypothetical protein